LKNTNYGRKKEEEKPNYQQPETPYSPYLSVYFACAKVAKNHAPKSKKKPKKYPKIRQHKK